MTDAQKKLLLQGRLAANKDDAKSKLSNSESDGKDSDSSLDGPTKSILDNNRPILVVFLGMCSDETEIYIQNFTRRAFSMGY